MVYICTKFGIANYDEYSLVYDLDADDGTNPNTKTATLRRVILFYYLSYNLFFICRIDLFNERIKKWKN